MHSGIRSLIVRCLLPQLAVLLLGGSVLAGAGDRNQERSAYLYRGITAFVPPDGLLNLGLSMATRSLLLPEVDLLASAEHTTVGLDLEYGLRTWLRLRFAVPYHSWFGQPDQPVSGGGIGDPLFGAVIGLPSPWEVLGLAVDLRTTLPVGDPSLGLGEGAYSRQYALAVGWRIWRYSQLPEMRLELNLGRRINGAEAGTLLPSGGSFEPWIPVYPGGRGAANDYDFLIAALGFRQGSTSLSVEYAAYDLPAAAGVSHSEDSRFLVAALRWGGEEGWALDAAVDIPLAYDDPLTVYPVRIPDLVYQVGLSRAFSVGGRDSDGDGFRDRVDACPTAAEDFDGFMDDDGCPDPDNDFDGVPDYRDGTPDHPEDIDGFQDEDGIPDPDNDLDGIPDRVDDCPDDPEDFDGYQDTDGCPEEFLDRDRDGLADQDDICPDEPEDMDGFQDEDGCPDLDNDLDGIPDLVDACPDKAEDYDGIADDDGCPE